MSAEATGEDPDEALVAAILEAEHEARLAELIRAPEQVEALIEQDALRLDFDLVLDLSGGLATLGSHDTAQLVAMSAFAEGDVKLMAAGKLALGWIELSRGKHRKALAEADGAVALANPDLDVVAEAAYLRGVILESRGKRAQAAAEYEKAIGWRRPRSAGLAALSLAEMLTEAGDDERAVQILAVAFECGVAHVVPQAALQLALIRDRLGDVEGSIPLYREAMESGVPSAAPRAAFHLGEILLGAGDAEGARDAFETAYATGDPEFTPKAAVNLGIIYMEANRVREAFACFETATGSPDRSIAALGHCYVGVVLADTDAVAAERHLGVAMKQGDRQVKEMASNVLRQLRQR
ncbi:tetratricopeptide repeat protein [Actinoallomurus sp. NPDC050550]|uniref:tetratricopeptide repeat protein n=1 Tax=Actinoallomurus sp. NPDC050550 TaxID=3154937 RepID=UPI0033E819D0